MAIPTVFAPIKSQDFTLRPFTVHKKFRLSSTDLISTASGYVLVDGLHTTLKTPIGSVRANNDPTNSFDGSYQHVIWKSIDHLYYRDPYNTFSTFEHSNRRFTYKELNPSASMLSIPYNDFGEAIKPRSVFVTNSSHAFTMQDDGNGNLYDPSISSASFTNSYNVVGYWGFNQEFRRFRYLQGTVAKGRLKYESRVFEPDDMSSVKNIFYGRGVENSGMQATFDGTSYILTNDRDEFNPDQNETFTVGFWMNAPVSQSQVGTAYNSIISKRGVIQKLTYGVNDKYTANDQLIQTKHISSSIEDTLTDVYPYDIELLNHTAAHGAGKIRVRRSNGSTVSQITSSMVVADGTDHYVTFLIGTGSMMLYVDGTLQGTAATLNNEGVYNRHSLMFGALNRNADQGYSGSLDEIRIYDTEITTAQIATLMDSSSMAMYQTAVVGNVFYRQGNVVISALHPKYTNTFKDTWTMAYRGTHTIYQYEVLCRVKKGSFNLSYNPTARKSFKSDLLLDEMTGSLLLPYATTIGLYNSEGDMVAVAKLGQAIQMRSDVDLNFLVRWDS